MRWYKQSKTLTWRSSATNSKINQLYSIKGTPNTHQTKTNERVQLNGQLNPRRGSGVAAFSGRRGLGLLSVLMKPNHRLYSASLSRLYRPKNHQGQCSKHIGRPERGTHNETVQKIIESNTSFLTPSKTVSAAVEANVTPKTMKFPIPSTPSTPSVPMCTSTTPAPQSVASVSTTMIREAREEIELLV